jgi:hypothetical protein
MPRRGTRRWEEPASGNLSSLRAERSAREGATEFLQTRVREPCRGLALGAVERRPEPHRHRFEVHRNCCDRSPAQRARVHTSYALTPTGVSHGNPPISNPSAIRSLSPPLDQPTYRLAPTEATAGPLICRPDLSGACRDPNSTQLRTAAARAVAAKARSRRRPSQTLGPNASPGRLVNRHWV